MRSVLTYAAVPPALCTLAAWLLHAPLVLVRGGAVITAAVALVGLVAEHGRR